MQASYAKAEARARDSHHPELFYPALNRMAAELIVNAARAGSSSIPRSERGAQESWPPRRATIPISGASPASSNCACTRDCRSRIWRQSDRRSKANSKSFSRVSAPSMWSSVIDQASFVLPKYAASAAERRAAEPLAQLRCVRWKPAGAQLSQLADVAFCRIFDDAARDSALAHNVAALSTYLR